MRRFFALFTRKGHHDQVDICDQAPHPMVLAQGNSRMLEVVRFTAEEDLLENAQPIFLAYTLEDEGIRIRGVFHTERELERYRSEHIAESPCHSVPAGQVKIGSSYAA